MPPSRTSTLERILASLTLAGAGAGALFASGDATGWAPAGTVLRVAFAVVVTAAAMRARRWSVVLPAAAATALADEVLLVVMGAAGLVTLFTLAVLRRHHRVAQGLAGALAVNVLLRLPDIEPTFATAAITALAVAPVLWTGYRYARRGERRQVRRALVAVSLLGLATIVGFTLALGLARASVEEAVQQAQGGLDAARDGRPEEAALRFDEATRQFDEANSLLRSPLAMPARLVPVLGANARALERATAMGAGLGGAGGTVARSVDADALKMKQGKVDVNAIRGLRQPVDDASRTLVAAGGTLTDIESPWLFEPIVDRLDELGDKVRSGRRDADTAADALAVAPDLLGGNGLRRYFVAFISPAEQRDLGGFMGSFALLEANGGNVELTQSGAAADLNRLTDLRLADPAAYPPRLVASRPDQFWQNVTSTADFPTSARLISELWQQATGQELHGVIAIDPKALAGLLEITGPVQVEGMTEPLTAENAEQYLLVDQYIQFPADREERQDVLANAVKATFERLTNGDLPSPRAAVDALTPAARGRRLMVWTPNPTEQEFFTGIEVDGAAPAPTARRAVLAVRTVNAGANKIDAYLERGVETTVQLDPSRGIARTTVVVTLNNLAPASGLPGAVIGNIKGQPPGTNLLDLVVEYGDDLVSATVNDLPAPVNVVEEHDTRLTIVRLPVPPMSARVVTLVFEGRAPISAGRYRLDVIPQPTANPDAWRVAVEVPGSYETERLPGSPPLLFTNDRDQHIGLRISGGER